MTCDFWSWIIDLVIIYQVLMGIFIGLSLLKILIILKGMPKYLKKFAEYTFNCFLFSYFCPCNRLSCDDKQEIWFQILFFEWWATKW